MRTDIRQPDVMPIGMKYLTAEQQAKLDQVRGQIRAAGCKGDELRADIAGDVARAVLVRAGKISANETRLRSKQYAEYRRIYDEVYTLLSPGATDVEMACPCAARPFPHHHAPEDAARARRVFSYQRGLRPEVAAR